MNELKEHKYFLNKETVELVKDPDRFITRNSGFLFIFCAIITYPIIILLNVFSDYMPRDMYFILAMILPNLVTLLLLFAFIFGYHQTSIMGFKKPEWRTMFMSVPLTLTIYPIMLFSSVLLTFLLPKSTMVMTGDTENMLLNIGPVGGYLILAVMPAVVEELICRGFIYGVFRRRDFFTAMLVTSFCFALLHGNLEQAVYTFIFSIFLCIIREMSGSIFPCMLMHMTLNSISTTLIYFEDLIFKSSSSETIEQSEPVEVIINTFADFWQQYSSLFIFSMISLAVAMVILIFIKKFNKFTLDKTVNTAYPAIAWTYIVGWVLLVVLSILSVL